RKYKMPTADLLNKSSSQGAGSSKDELLDTARNLMDTLNTFGVKAKVTDISQGPSVTRYELQPEVGVRVNKIVSLSDDLKLALAATDIRIEAPIPGKSAVGIEVPNKVAGAVSFRELIEDKTFKNFDSKIAFAVGKDIAGNVVVTDIAKMPHMLIAGATGSGKSVCINTIIMSILYKANPDEVKLIMIDPKVVELSVYNGIPHLMVPVVTDPKKAAAALHWGVAEMTKRYQLFAEMNVRDLKGYNKAVENNSLREDEEKREKLPQIVIIVDELADLMMVAAKEVEESICRLAQLARACGIHLVIATQRPSVDVITGLIKANMPSRVAFAVSSGTDSRTILDMNGAEKLLGKGDMLFFPQGYPKPARIQGAFISDSEVSQVVDFLRSQNYGDNNGEEMLIKMDSAATTGGGISGDDDRDELFEPAGRFIIESDKASIGSLQRKFKIGFNRAARIMDQLSDAGVVGPEEGTKPRQILMNMSQFDDCVNY
ncbi:MAG: DNA translocase FtsK, partial [Lachnospiraceae bacterium]|nr:DNA translocase FtsK [Lachnospiraceae bacterium]